MCSVICCCSCGIGLFLFVLYCFNQCLCIFFDFVSLGGFFFLIW